MFSHYFRRALFKVGNTIIYPPIITFGAPITMAFGAPASRTKSPKRAAGNLLIRTVVLPTAITPPTWGFRTSTRGHVCISEIALQAGRPPIRTFTLPGPGARGVPWLVMSPIRAAGGI